MKILMSKHPTRSNHRSPSCRQESHCCLISKKAGCVDVGVSYDSTLSHFFLRNNNRVYNSTALIRSSRNLFRQTECFSPILLVVLINIFSTGWWYTTALKWETAESTSTLDVVLDSLLYMGSLLLMTVHVAYHWVMDS